MSRFLRDTFAAAAGVIKRFESTFKVVWASHARGSALRDELKQQNNWWSDKSGLQLGVTEHEYMLIRICYAYIGSKVVWFMVHG